MIKHLWIIALAIAGLITQSDGAFGTPPSGASRPAPNLRLPPPDMRNRLPQAPPPLPSPAPRTLPQLVPGPLGIGNPITEHGIFIPKGNGGVVLEGGPHGGGVTIIKPVR